ENSRFAQMVNGVAFRIKVSSIEKETVYITGSKFTTKSKHKARRWFPKSGEHTTRTVANVNRIFSELLLQKEARHYYRQPLNHELYKSILRNQFIRSDFIHIHPEVKAKEPVIMDSLMEEAALSDLTIHENATESNYPSIMGYFGKLSVAGLGMYYRHDLDARAEYGLYETSIGRVIEKHMIANVVPRIHEVNYHINSLRKSSGEYAATFQLKKNIPEKTLERMNTSPLLKYFDEVEYDELVDLETIKQFENEIISFIKTFKIPVPANASFKVRRLGKIKAAGVFYPFYNTLAVDVNHPNSFIHEYWHMIDYYMKDNSSHFTGERLSSRRDFLDIVKEYKDVVGKTIEKLPDSSAVKCLHYGKTKYNKDYYFENTEVFARCAEMYFAKALNGKSSLVGDVESAYYPTDSKLNDMINQYFTNLLLEVDHEKTDAA
ncbi:MAG: hypothetical protein IBX70_14020, partial [Clostridia bacterium]|nr:hypothetical protein [Clostridia bacterium]